MSFISINGLGLMCINLLEYYINVNHNSILKFSVYPKNKKVKEGIGWRVWIVIVHTQLLLDRLGLGLGSQLTCRVGLVFPNKGSSSPSDPMTPLSSWEHPYLPLCVALPLSIASSLSLSLSLQNCQPPSSHSILLFIVWGGWRRYDYSLISLVWVGSNLIIPYRNMLCWEWL